MSLLTIIQSVCLRSGITDAPNFVIGNTDTTIGQLLELLREECSELYHRHPWTRLQVEGTFNTVAADLQGDLSVIAPDFGRFVSDGDTIWNRAFSEPINSPITAASWQALKARLAVGPCYNMRLRRNPVTLGEAIYLIPQPPAGQAVYFEYVSRYIVKSAAAAPQTDWLLDTDSPLLPEHLLKHGLRWRWKKEKGLSYAEDFNTYEAAVARAWAADGGGAPTLEIGYSTANDSGLIGLGNIPDGNWPH